MDPKSGIFTAIVPGCYLFCLTLCSQDMKKVLVALRKNGEEVRTLLKKGKIKPLFRLGQSTTKTTTTTTGTAWQARVFFLSWNKGIESRFVSLHLLVLDLLFPPGVCVHIHRAT